MARSKAKTHQASKRRQVASEGSQQPFDPYASLDLGPGGYARVPATDLKRGIREVLEKKLKR